MDLRLGPVPSRGWKRIIGPFDPVGEAEADIEILAMPRGLPGLDLLHGIQSARIPLQWDDHALMRQAYKGLARRIKNEMVHHNKPLTLLGLRKLVQAIDSSVLGTKGRGYPREPPSKQSRPEERAQGRSKPRHPIPGQGARKPESHPRSNRETWERREVDAPGAANVVWTIAFVYSVGGLGT